MWTAGRPTRTVATVGVLGSPSRTPSRSSLVRRSTGRLFIAWLLRRDHRNERAPRCRLAGSTVATFISTASRMKKISTTGAYRSLRSWSKAASARVSSRRSSRTMTTGLKEILDQSRNSRSSSVMSKDTTRGRCSRNDITVDIRSGSG